MSADLNLSCPAGATPQAPVAREAAVVSRPVLFRFLTAQQIISQPPPRWLIAGLIATDTLAVLYGAPGAGKSFLALEWALSVAAGRNSLGRGVEQGDAAYVYAEGGGGIPLRLRAWEQKRGELPARFFGLPRPVVMPYPGEVDALISDMRAQGIHPALIVIDTLARCFGASNENAQQDMNAFVRGCDELREAFPSVAVLVVHHTGWVESRERGSNALRAASDTVLAVDRTKEGFVRLKVERQKDAPVPDRPTLLVLEKVPIAKTGGSCVVELANVSAAHAASIAEKSTGRPPAKSDTRALEVLKAAGPAGLTSGGWRERSGLPGSTLKDARQRLSARGAVVRRDDRWFIADPQQDGQPNGWEC